jgi:two-component system sensor histidine kinase/response regulator
MAGHGEPAERQQHEIEQQPEGPAAGRAMAERDAYAAMLRAVVDNSQSLIYVKDLEGRYLLANAALERAIAVREADLLGQTDDFVDPVLAPTWRANDLRARQGAYRVEEYSDAPDGRHVFESMKFPLYDADAQLYATCGVSLDVTEARRAMRAAEQARDEALVLSQVKSQFLATVSHEIRTPMNGVIGLASLLLGTDLDPRQRRYVGGVHSAGSALLGVINDILDFSKIEAGKLVLDADDFDLSAVLTEVTALVTPTEQDNVAVVARRDQRLPTMVRGDGGRLRQILLNLAGNAVKFTAHGRVTVRADLAVGPPRDPQTIWVRFEISDTGIGIHSADADRLFNPFIQADASTTSTYGGTGLGLAICRELTEAMGGTIGVESEPGQGSTFWCLIPFGPAHVPEPDVGSSPALDLTGLRVLVVDAGASQAMLQASLRRWKIASIAVDTGAGAVRALRQAADRGRPLDVTIIDADLVGVDPTDLARRISRDRHIPAVYVIVLNHSGPTDAEAAATDGISAYLPKLFHRSQLYESVAKAMASARPAVVAPRQAASVVAASSRLGPRRVLLVEDNEINQMVALGILTSLGYLSDVAKDGLEAVGMATTRSYDAVLMDCRMPRMDGFNATAELRRQEDGGPRTPIIAMTASALVADRVRCLAAGMDDYITKPVDPGELATTLDRWISGTATDAAAAAILGPRPTAEVAEPASDPVARRLEELRGDHTEPERALVNRLVVSFLTRAPSYLSTLIDAVTTADAAAVENQAHSLKGAAGNIGAAGIVEICERLEILGRAGNLDASAAVDLDRLQTEIKTVDTRLRMILNLNQHSP